MAVYQTSFRRLLRRTVVGAACFIILLGTCMVVLWLNHNTWPEPLVRGFFYMKFNMSLAFIGGDIGLLAALRRSKRYTNCCPMYFLTWRL